MLSTRGPRSTRCHRQGLGPVRHHDHPLDGGDRSCDFFNPTPAIEALAVVLISIRGEQDPRFNLPQAIDTPAVPKSGEHELQIAPILDEANMAVMVSGRFGRKAAMRSPLWIPNCLNAAAKAATS